MKVKYIYHPIVEPEIVGIVSVVTLILSIFITNILIITFGIFYIAVAIYAHWYVRKLSNITWSITQHQKKLFIDDSHEINITFTNPSKFVINQLIFNFQSEEGLKWSGEGLKNQELSTDHYNFTLSIDKENEKIYKLKATGLKRGSYSWRFSEVLLKDPFHLVSVSITDDNKCSPNFKIYPKMTKVKIPDQKKWKFGYRNARVSPMLDETKIIGVKEYEKEGFRSIHWSASAKSAKLVAKKFEHTQGDRFSICLNLDGKNGFMLRKDLEELIEFSTGLCKEIINQNCSFELWINKQSPKGIVHLSNGKGRKQLHQALEVFASITENDLPTASRSYYKNVFRKKDVGSVPLIIGKPPEEFNRQNPWILVRG